MNNWCYKVNLKDVILINRDEKEKIKEFFGDRLIGMETEKKIGGQFRVEVEQVLSDGRVVAVSYSEHELVAKFIDTESYYTLDKHTFELLFRKVPVIPSILATERFYAPEFTPIAGRIEIEIKEGNSENVQIDAGNGE